MDIELLLQMMLLLNLYRKNKDILFYNIAFFIVESYFKDLMSENSHSKEKIYEIKSFVCENLNNFLKYNMNQNSMINAVNNKLNHV